MNESLKTVFRYDSGKKGFKTASLFLISLSVILVIFGFYWILSWF